MQKYTVYDIAELADVSASTVSRVLNHHPYVKDATRAKVLKVLEQYSYIPDETARSLATQMSRMIGLMVADIRTTHHTDALYYIEREFSRRGYCCIILNTGADEADQAKNIQILSQRKVEAAILIGSTYQSATIREAVERYMPETPVMLFNGCLDAPNIYGLLADEEDGVFRSVRLLSGKGKRNIAFIVDWYTPSNKLKIQGYERGMSRYCGGSPVSVTKAEPGTQGAYDATTDLLERYPDVNGIIYAEDLLAVAEIRALADMGISIPDSIAVIGINNSEYAKNSVPALTSLDNMLYEMSHKLVRNLIFIQKGREVPRCLRLPTKLVEREST